MSDYFPADICIEILRKLPVKSLIRFTAVCKSWKCVITSPNFISAHLSNAEHHALLRRYESKQEHFSLLEFTGNNGSFGVQSCSEYEFPFEKSVFGFFRIVGSCDGLVCLTDDFFSNPSKPVMLWNPSIRNHVQLPQPIANPKGPYTVVLGFGVADGVHKVVRLVYCRIPDDSGFGVPPHAEVFSLRTGRWRKVCGFDIKLRIIEFMWHQVLLNGVVHWLGYEPMDYGVTRGSILTFDIGNEVFGEVMLPDSDSDSLAVTSLNLFKIGGSLAVVRAVASEVEEGCDVWIMKEYGVRESWTKVYKIELNKGFVRVVGFRNGEALLAYEEEGLVAYNLETKQRKNLGIYGVPRAFYIDDYVESLLLLKGSRDCEPAVEDLIRNLVEGLSLDTVSSQEEARG